MKSWVTRKNGYKIDRVLCGRSNVFMLSNTTHRVLVDTSPNYRKKRLYRELGKLNVKKIDALILTHTHYDHVGNAQSLKETYNPDVIVHRSEESFIKNGTNNGEGMIPKGTNAITRLIGVKLVAAVLARVTFDPCMPDVLTEDRYELDQYRFNAYLLHTPGHSIGSMSVIVDDEIAICGDTVFGVFPGAVCPPWAYDYPKMIQNWERLLDTGCSLFLPSHGNERSRLVLQKEHMKAFR